MAICCALGCKSRTKSRRTEEDSTNKLNGKRRLVTKFSTNKSFFRLPKNEERQRVWLRILKVPDYVPSKWTCVCSDHFSEDAFKDNHLRRILKKNALPNDDPSIVKVCNKRGYAAFQLRPQKSYTQSITEDESGPMPRACSAWYCSNLARASYREPPLNIHCFHFPSANFDPELRKKWIVAVSSGRRDGFNPSENAVLCSIHFENSDFLDNFVGGRTKLKPKAVPTLFYIPNFKEEQSIVCTGKKARTQSLSSKMPRRLRKIYVDEHEETNAVTGEMQKSFSFFVLPFAFAKNAPWTPEFGYERPELVTISNRKPMIPPKSQTVTLAIVNKAAADKSTSDKPTAPVIYLKKCNPPTFPHLTLPGTSDGQLLRPKPVPVKLAVSSLNKSAISNNQKSIVITTDPLNKKCQIRWISNAKTSESGINNVKITDVVSLASSSVSDFDDIVEEIVPRAENADTALEDPLSVDATQAPTDVSEPMIVDSVAAEETKDNDSGKENSELGDKDISEIENDSSETPAMVEAEPSKNPEIVEKAQSKNSATVEAEPSKITESVEKEMSNNPATFAVESSKNSETVEKEKSKNSRNTETVEVEKSKNSVTVESEPSKTTETVEVEKSKNSVTVESEASGDTENVEKEKSKNSENIEEEAIKDTEIVEKEKSKNSVNVESEPSEVAESTERNESDSNKTPRIIKPVKNKKTFLAIRPSFQKSRLDQFWHRHCFATRNELSYAGEYEDDNVIPKSRSAYATFSNLKAARSVIARENKLLERRYNIPRALVMVERLESQVSGQSASSFRGPTRSRRKFKNTNLGPTKTFYYDTPPEMYKNLPMNPVQVSFNSCPRFLSKKGYTEQRRFINQPRTAKETERLKKVINFEHNYCNRETYVDADGRTVHNDPRVGKLTEKILQLKKTLKHYKQKCVRVEKTVEKKVDRLKETFATAKRERFAPFEQTNVHPVVKDIFLCELKNATAQSANFKRYSETMKEFCCALLKISPKAYDFMRGFFNFPNKQKIRNFQLNPFQTSQLVPRPKPPKVKRSVEGGEVVDGIQLPTEPVPMDLEMNDLMYDLDEPEDQPDEGDADESGEDEYENVILQNPTSDHQPDSAANRTAVQSRIVATTPTSTPVKRRVTPSRKSKKRKVEEEEEEESEEQGFGEGSVAHQQWMREQQEYERKGVQQQQQQPHVYNLYANPQPGPSTGGRNQPGASMPDVYLGPDSLKSFDSYYF